MQMALLYKAVAPIPRADAHSNIPPSSTLGLSAPSLARLARPCPRSCCWLSIAHLTPWSASHGSESDEASTDPNVRSAILTPCPLRPRWSLSRWPPRRRLEQMLVQSPPTSLMRPWTMSPSYWGSCSSERQGYLMDGSFYKQHLKRHQQKPACLPSLTR